MDNFDLRSYLSSNPLTEEISVLEGIDFLKRVGINLQINEAIDQKALDVLKIASTLDGELNTDTEKAIFDFVNLGINTQDAKDLLDPTLTEEEKDEEKNKAFMNIVRNLQKIGKTNLLPLIMALTIMSNAVKQPIEKLFDNPKDKIEKVTTQDNIVDADTKVLDATDFESVEAGVTQGGEDLNDANENEDVLADFVGGFETGKGTSNQAVDAELTKIFSDLDKETVGKTGEINIDISGHVSNDSGADSNKSSTSDLPLDQERAQTIKNALEKELEKSGNKINGVKVNVKIVKGNDFNQQKTGDAGKGVFLKTTFDTTSTQDIPVDTEQDVVAFLNPLYARWRDVRFVEDTIDKVKQKFSKAKVTDKSSTATPPPPPASKPKPSTKKVTSSQTAKDVKSVQSGNLNRNGQIATVLRTLNFDNLNIFKEMGETAAKSLTDSDLKKVIENPESTDTAKNVAKGILQIRKNPDKLLQRVSSVLGVELDPRAKAVQLKPGQAGQSQFRAGVAEGILSEAFVDDFISDEDIRNNKVAILSLLGSMYASDTVKGEYLSIANPDKLGFSDSERAEFEKLGWTRKDDSGNYVFLDASSAKKQEKKKVPDADKAAQMIGKTGGAEQKLDYINTKDELVDMLVQTWNKFDKTYKTLPSNIRKVFNDLRTELRLRLSEEEEKELKDVSNVFKVLQTNKSLDSQLSRINTNDEAKRVIRDGILAYINDVLLKNPSILAQAMRDASNTLVASLSKEQQPQEPTNERKLTKSELAKREDIIMKMKDNKRALVQKYGKDAEKVMYGRATKLAKKQAEAMDQDRIKEMVKAALMGPVKEDQVEEGNAFIVAADAARDAGKKEFEFPKGSGKMHPVKIKADIDEVDNSEYAMAVRASKAYKPGPKPSPKRHPKPKNASDLRKLDALEKRRAQIMRDMEQEAEMEGGPIADRYGDMLNKIDKAIAMLSEDNLSEGFYGPGSVESVANALGYSDVYEFFEDNPGVTDAILDWAENVPEFREKLQNADLMEDLDLGHQDNEPHMLKADLYRIGKYAMELYQMVDQFEGKGEVDFPHWWQSKIIKAKDMLVSAKHYLDFEVNEPQIDAMVDVAQEEDVIDENALGMSDSRLSSDQHRDLDYAVRGDSAYTFGNDPYADDQLRYKYAKKMGFLEEADSTKSLKDLVNSVSKKGNLNDVIARAKDMAKKEGLDFSDEEIELEVENSFDRMMGLGENARDKAAMAFNKMKVGATIKTSKGEFKKVDDKHFEMVEKPGRKFTAKQMTFIKEENLNEGTWSLGSANEIKDAIHTLEMWYDLDAREISALFDDKDNSNFFYNVVGDDLFHDALDRAEREAATDNTDRAHNAVTDAIGRAEELLAIVRERESSRPYPTDSIFEDEIEEGLPKGYFKKEFGIGKKKKMAESFDELVDKLKDQGKSEKVAKKIAGAVNAAYKQRYR